MVNFFEDTFFKIVYKLGFGKYAVRMIKAMDIDKDDADYKTYISYMIRKHVARRLIKQQWVNLSWDIGGDSLYIVRHFIHQKKNKIMQEEEFHKSKKLNDLTGMEFEDLLYRLFKSMDYKVLRVEGEVDKVRCLILDLKDQKILLYAKRESNFIQDKDIDDALQAQINYNCNGTMFISISGFTKEALEMASSKNVGLITKERLSELLLQFLKEKWN